MSSASKIIQAAAGNAAGEALYVEEVFSTYLYDGTGSAQTITNDIDLDGEGGLVWVKWRSGALGSSDHALYDTERGVNELLRSNKTDAEVTATDSLTSFNSNGFTLGADSLYGRVNYPGTDMASWTFRKAPKFFDVVTYTGNGTAGREIAHNLGTTVGCVIIKNRSSAENWMVYHRGSTGTDGIDGQLNLNSTAAATDDSSQFDDTVPSSTVLTLGSNAEVNFNGDEYVAYLFAHNNGDGDFGESGDQDIIKCGSYTGNGSSDGPEIDLGFEPQWVLIKNADIVQNWYVIDNMRGMAVNVTNGDATLLPNTNGSENTANIISPLPDGFKITASNSQYNGSGNNIIYIAIRRGPMKTPESGTEVFTLQNNPTTTPAPAWKTNFPVDVALVGRTTTWDGYIGSRLTGESLMQTNGTAAESANSNMTFDYSNGFGETAFLSSAYMGYLFRRAPGFFDVVAYEGDGASSQTIQHNLGVAPELIIGKGRSFTSDWPVYYGSGLNNVFVNLAQAQTGLGAYFETGSAFTAISSTTQFDVSLLTGGNATKSMNTASEDYILYLFATLDGVSKVGSYTGNGTSQTIDCGFSAGARFVMTKRTNTTGNWNVFDTARGIVAGNDPRLELNTTDAEDTGHDYIDPDNSGFVVNYVADDDDDSNVSGDTYIFLAIA